MQLLALIFLMTVRSFHEADSSMQPTLMRGDEFYVDLITWGYGPHTFAIPLPLQHRLGGQLPRRGEIAVYYAAFARELFVKRIVGMPGDRVQMLDGRLIINGELVPRRELDQRIDHNYAGDVPVIAYEETLPGASPAVVIEMSDDEQFDDTPEFTVPAGHYFMMGDNRDNSVDSRALFHGFVPLADLIGRVSEKNIYKHAPR